MDVGLSPTARYALQAAPFLLGVAGGAYLTRFAFHVWFPALERLPDTAKSRLDRSRGWIQAGVGLWASIVLGLLALPPYR